MATLCTALSALHLSAVGCPPLLQTPRPPVPCRLPFIVEPLACAAGLEAVIPCRLQEGPINRALCKESSKMQSPCDITAHPEVFARVVT